MTGESRAPDLKKASGDDREPKGVVHSVPAELGTGSDREPGETGESGESSSGDVAESAANSAVLISSRGLL